MGGSVMLLMHRGQVGKLKRVLSKNLLGPVESVEVGGIVTNYTPNVWLTYKGNLLEICYTFSDGNSQRANAIAQQIIRRYQVRKAGWDSIGYCDLEEVANVKPFRLQIESIERMNFILRFLFRNSKKRLIIRQENYISAASKLFKE